jgi:hypothetical protein
VYVAGNLTLINEKTFLTLLQNRQLKKLKMFRLFQHLLWYSLHGWISRIKNYLAGQPTWHPLFKLWTKYELKIDNGHLSMIITTSGDHTVELQGLDLSLKRFTSRGFTPNKIFTHLFL